MAEKQTKLDVLFPDREVTLSNGNKVTVHPLMLNDLPKVIRVLAKIFQKAKDVPESENGEKNYLDLVISASEDVMELVPFCVDGGTSSITLADAPGVIEIILDQNLTDEALGKWTALIQKVAGQLGVDLDAMVDQGKEALKKK